MNCSFNIRYKPKTTRAFTKSDLTVYDSAGNTALNALTVYGKSEVVDGTITSAGEGWATVRLADLAWNYNATGTLNPFFWTYTELFPSGNIKYNGNYSTTLYNLICSAYPTVKRNETEFISKTFTVDGAINKVTQIQIKNTDYTTVSDFVASLGDATLCYQLADPSQGNAIAVKTDNGTGIDGTMATFSTGTPLRGIPDTTVRDVMAWDGSAGAVTKNCGGVRLADLEWKWWNQHPNILYADVSDKQLGLCGMMCSAYPYRQDIGFTFSYESSYPDKTIYCSNTSAIYIKNTDYNTKEDFVASLGNAELVYELATPTNEQLTSTENASIAGLKTFEPQTHAQNNAGAEMTVDYTIRVPTI